MLIMCRKNSWASCCRLVEKSGCPLPIRVLNINGLIPSAASSGLSVSCFGGPTHLSVRIPKPNLVLQTIQGYLSNYPCRLTLKWSYLHLNVKISSRISKIWVHNCCCLLNKSAKKFKVQVKKSHYNYNRQNIPWASSYRSPILNHNLI